MGTWDVGTATWERTVPGTSCRGLYSRPKWLISIMKLHSPPVRLGLLDFYVKSASSFSSPGYTCQCTCPNISAIWSPMIPERPSYKYTCQCTCSNISAIWSQLPPTSTHVSIHAPIYPPSGAKESLRLPPTSTHVSTHAPIYPPAGAPGGRESLPQAHVSVHMPQYTRHLEPQVGESPSPKYKWQYTCHNILPPFGPSKYTCQCTCSNIPAVGTQSVPESPTQVQMSVHMLQYTRHWNPKCP